MAHSVKPLSKSTIEAIVSDLTKSSCFMQSFGGKNREGEKEELNKRKRDNMEDDSALQSMEKPTTCGYSSNGLVDSFINHYICHQSTSHEKVTYQPTLYFQEQVKYNQNDLTTRSTEEKEEKSTFVLPIPPQHDWNGIDPEKVLNNLLDPQFLQNLPRKVPKKMHEESGKTVIVKHVNCAVINPVDELVSRVQSNTSEAAQPQSDLVETSNTDISHSTAKEECPSNSYSFTLKGNFDSLSSGGKLGNLESGEFGSTPPFLASVDTLNSLFGSSSVFNSATFQGLDRDTLWNQSFDLNSLDERTNGCKPEST